MAATVFVLCPVCRKVMERRTDLDAISHDTVTGTEPCQTCRMTPPFRVTVADAGRYLVDRQGAREDVELTAGETVEATRVIGPLPRE